MGLDQYLKHVNEDGEEGEIYWRKCNFVQRFFQEKLGELNNCQCYDIEDGWIAELIEKCRDVLRDHSLADMLLPTESGFFWGSIEYDEWYYADVEYTLEKLDEVKNDSCFTYWAWW